MSAIAVAFLTPTVCEISNKKGIRRRNDSPFANASTDVAACAFIFDGFTARNNRVVKWLRDRNKSCIRAINAIAKHGWKLP